MRARGTSFLIRCTRALCGAWMICLLIQPSLFHRCPNAHATHSAPTLAGATATFGPNMMASLTAAIQQSRDAIQCNTPTDQKPGTPTTPEPCHCIGACCVAVAIVTPTAVVSYVPAPVHVLEQPIEVTHTAPRVDAPDFILPPSTAPPATIA